MLRKTVSRPVSLGVDPHLGSKTRSWLLSDSCVFVDVGRPLRREDGSVSLQLLLAVASAVILGSESLGTHDRILLFQIQDSINLEGQILIFISFRNRVAQLYPQALGSLFIASYDSQGYGGSIRTRLNAGLVINQSQSQSYFTVDGLAPISSSWRRAPWDSRLVILFFNWTLAAIVLTKYPLWRED
jgi:hypothetical protein